MPSYQIVAWGENLVSEETQSPEVSGTEVLIRTSVCGVCHSDLHIWDGYFDLGGGRRATLEDRGVALPFTMGHEIVGEVVAAGPQAEGAAIGQRRVVYPWIGCRACEPCARGDDLMCLSPSYLGTRVDGGYGDHVIVPHPRYLIDFNGIPEDLACTYACAGLTAYSALKKIPELTDNDTLLIIGAGGVGLSAVNVARAVTPARLVVADIDPDKRAAAIAAGAAETIDNGADGAARSLVKATRGGVAAAIDFVGAPVTTKFGMDVLRKGGTHVIVGLYGSELAMSLPMFPFKLMTVRGSFTGTLDELGQLIDLAKAGRITPLPIATRPFREVNRTLTDLREGRIVGRVVLQHSL